MKRITIHYYDKPCKSIRRTGGVGHVFVRAISKVTCTCCLRERANEHWLPGFKGLKQSTASTRLWTVNPKAAKAWNMPLYKKRP